MIHVSSDVDGIHSKVRSLVERGHEVKARIAIQNERGNGAGVVGRPEAVTVTVDVKNE
jgi:hypothetical protein